MRDIVRWNPFTWRKQVMERCAAAMCGATQKLFGGFKPLEWHYPLGVTNSTNQQPKDNPDAVNIAIRWSRLPRNSRLSWLQSHSLC